MTEFELKFQVPPGRGAEVEAAMRRGGVRAQRLRARYFDTPNEALAQAGIVLRLRQEGRVWVQTAKAAGDTPFERLEENVAIRDRGRPSIDLSRHAGTPLGERLARALDDQHEAVADLQACYEIDVQRLVRVVEAGGTSVELALDTGRIRSGTRSLRVHEIEFELQRGSVAALFELAGRWCEAHGLWLDPLPKSMAGQRLARGEQQAPPWQARLPDARARDSGEWLAAALDAGLHQALGNAREIVAGSWGAEHVHQLRVGLRRMRTVLRELAHQPAVNALADAVDAPLGDLFGLLGGHRDRHALLPDQLARLQAIDAPRIDLPPEGPDIAEAIRSTTVQTALLQVAAFQQALRAGDVPTPALPVLRAHLATAARRLHRKALLGGRRFAGLPADERHRVRKQIKRLRYLCELARPLFHGRKVDRYVAALRHLQDELGLYQDAETGRVLWTTHAAEAPGAWFAAGWCAAHAQTAALRCEKVCRRTAKNLTPWWEAAG